MIGANVAELNAIQRRMDSGWAAIVRPAIDEMRGVLLANADKDGLIPPAVARLVKARLSGILINLFGRNGQAYTFDHRPLAPFPALVNEGIVRVTVAAVMPHYRYMQRIVPDDVERALGMQVRVNEQVERLFSINPLAKYDPAHTWVDPNGYTLSPRIWRAGVRATLQLNNMLDDMIGRGMSAVAMSGELENALLPSRAGIRTNKPYSRDLSFDAMRLARSEITRAHSQASFIAAMNNPYVGAMQWRLSPRHPRIDICDDIAAGGPHGNGIYPLSGHVPLPVQDSHPLCICNVAPVVIQSAAITTEQLRLELSRAKTFNQEPNITPLLIEGFLRLLLGGYLFEQAQEWIELEEAA